MSDEIEAAYPLSMAARSRCEDAPTFEKCLIKSVAITTTEARQKFVGEEQVHDLRVNFGERDAPDHRPRVECRVLLRTA
jgi:hypothetical protein